jgi:hypothetical protein
LSSFAFPDGLLWAEGIFPVLLLSPDPEDGLFGGRGVWESVPERSLWLPPVDCADTGPVFRAIMAAAKNNVDIISFRFINSPFFFTV